MEDLIVEAVENGFVVLEGSGRDRAMMGKKWAFETPKALAEFVEEWGEEKDRSNIGKE